MLSSSVTSSSIPLESQSGKLLAVQANLFLSFCPAKRTTGIVGGLPDLRSIRWHVNQADNFGIIASLSDHGAPQEWPTKSTGGLAGQ